MLLAEIQVDAAREQAAERLVHDAAAPRSRAWRAATPIEATRTCVCGAPGLVDQHRRARWWSPARRAPAARAFRAAQSPNAFSTSGRRSADDDLARHDERGVVRHEVLRPELLHVVACHRLVRRLGAELGEAVRVRRAVERGGHRGIGDLAADSPAAAPGCASRLARWRSISSAGKLGCRDDVRHHLEQRRKRPPSDPALDLRRIHRRSRDKRSRRGGRPRRRSAARSASPSPRRALRQ